MLLYFSIYEYMLKSENVDEGLKLMNFISSFIKS